jgi:hypothetical protein
VDLTFLLNTVLPVVLLALVWLVGGLLAVVTWKRNPTASLLALLACLLLLAVTVVGAALQHYLVTRRLSFQRGWSTAEFNLLWGVVYWGRTLLSAVGYVLLLCAVFVGRGRAAPPPVPFDASGEPPRADRPRDSADIQKRQQWS